MRLYTNFSLEEFLQDEAFRRWILERSPEDEAFWQQWLIDHPQKQATVEQARMLLASIYGMQHAEISEEEVQHSIRQVIAQTEEVKEKRSLTRRLPVPTVFELRWWQLAASISVMVGIAWWGISHKEEVKTPGKMATTVNKPAQSFIVKINHSEKPMLINLSDGSTILLQKEGRIRYPQTFTGMNREVQLAGAAFFEIQKNPKAPFFVHTREVVTKVLGTSFYVKADSAQQRVTVSVKTGKVSVYATSSTRTLANRLAEAPDAILNPNQQMVYEVEKPSSMQARPIHSDISMPDTHFEFSSTPLPQVFAALEEAYGVAIHFDKSLLQECSITATFTDEPFMTKLDLICKSIGLRYEVGNAEVEIIGPGCLQ